MNSRAILCFASCSLAVFRFTDALAQSTHTPLLKGDRAYDREQYAAAEKQYRIAADLDVANAQPKYNLGNALYLQGNWEDAEQRFRQATSQAKQPAQQADALHNLGNSFLKQKKLKEAVRAYEKSLRLRPADTGTKQNLQMAKKMLRVEEQKQQEQEQKNQEEQEQQNQGQPQQENQQSQQVNQEDKPNSSQPNQAGQKQGREQQEQEAKIKKEDAKRLLETAVEPEDRKNTKKYRAAQQQAKTGKSKKDWR